MKILSCLIIAAFSMAAAARVPQPEVFPLELLHERSGRAREQNLRFWARHYLGTPYDATGPLGEGPNGRFDQDPLYRFDAFDCATFVETVISLSRSRDKESFKFNMNLIRYNGGRVSYVERNHISSLAWIPRNERNGFFEDETAYFPGHFVRTARGLIDYPNWLRFHKPERLKLPGLSSEKKAERLRELKELADNYRPEEVDLDYLEIKALLNDWRSFKSAFEGVYVVNIVRPNWRLREVIGTNLHISHQGLAFVENGLIQFYHASSSGEAAKVSLRSYLENVADSETIKGINLLRL